MLHSAVVPQQIVRL